jgi:hypothetical protein
MLKASIKTLVFSMQHYHVNCNAELIYRQTRDKGKKN